MNHEDALPNGTRVGDFEIRRVIGWGGSGIVYEAYDPGLDRVVALKELFLAQHSCRSGLDVLPVKPSSVAVCEAGKARFLREARLLAMLHERASGTASLVIVHRVLQQNHTAYMAMKLYSGETLRTVISRDAGRITQGWLVALMLRLLDALEALHGVPGEHLVHRDVSPDNIILQPDGVPVLLDFGATRSTKGEVTAIIFKPGFSPIEQYTDSYPQGPWTDLYALCGVAYFAICGEAPDESVTRLAGKVMVPAAVRGAGRFTPEFLAVIDQGLGILPWDRFLDVPAMRAALLAVPAVPGDPSPPNLVPLPAAAMPTSDADGWLPTQFQPTRDGRELDTVTAPVSEMSIPTVRQPLLPPEPSRLGLFPNKSRPPALVPTVSNEQAQAAAAVPAPRPWWGIALVAAAVLLVVATLFVLRKPAPTPEQLPRVVASPPPANPDVAPAQSATAATIAQPAATVVPAPAFVAGLDCSEGSASWACVVAGLARTTPAANLEFSISPSVARAGERLSVSAMSGSGGYLYVYSIDDHAAARAEQLFPNPRDRNNQMLPGVAVQLPRPNWDLELQPPVGRVWIVAVVTREPLPAAAGNAEAPALAAAVQAFAQRQPMRSLGWPACAGASCTEALAVRTTEMTIR